MKTVHKLNVGDGSVVLVPGDVHFGSCDLPVFHLMLEAAEDAGITHVVLQGDTFDGVAMSKHSKEALRANSGELTIQYEIDEGTEPMASLASLVPGGHAVIMPGNHDGQRTERFINENPGFAGMEWYDLYAPALEGWTKLPNNVDVKAGALNIAHGHRIRGLERGGGVTPCRTVLSNYPGQNTLFGHTHRRSFDTRPTWKDGRQVVHGAWNVGHLQDLAKVGTWINDPAWEQSFALVSYHEVNRELYFDVSLARVLRDRRNRPTVLVSGRAYR